MTCGSETNDESRAATRNNPGAPSEAASAWIQMRKLFTITIDYRVLSSRALFWWAVAAAFVVGAVARRALRRPRISRSATTTRAAHLVVARRIVDSITPGWQQIGAVWLPLPHLLNALPVQVDALYRTGASGVAISIAAFAIAAGAIAWIVARAHRIVAGAASPAPRSSRSNPNVLYLQSTPMTEPLLLALTLAAASR